MYEAEQIAGIIVQGADDDQVAGVIVHEADSGMLADADLDSVVGAEKPPPDPK